MDCRMGCGACCIAPSISSPLPGMPSGKPAGVRCVSLTDDMRCRVYDTRPQVCRHLQPSHTMCRDTAEEAMEHLTELEQLTKP